MSSPISGCSVFACVKGKSPVRSCSRVWPVTSVIWFAVWVRFADLGFFDRGFSLPGRSLFLFALTSVTISMSSSYRDPIGGASSASSRDARVCVGVNSKLELGPSPALGVRDCPASVSAASAASSCALASSATSSIFIGSGDGVRVRSMVECVGVNCAGVTLPGVGERDGVRRLSKVPSLFKRTISVTSTGISTMIEFCLSGVRSPSPSSSMASMVVWSSSSGK